MELKDIIELLKKNREFLITVCLFFMFVGVGLYFALPKRYTASGSFYIKRFVYESSPEFFTYEGYYGQQAASSYTDTVIALFESVDLQKAVLEKLNLQTTDAELRSIKRRIRVKKAGPQLITVTVKGSTQSFANDVWNALAEETLAVVENVNAEGDTTLSIEKLSSEPVLQQTYSNVFINAFIGLSLGFIMSVVWLSFKEYLN
ncbi:MAG: YveK family protein [Patescibacteria group bacterium]